MKKYVLTPFDVYQREQQKDNQQETQDSLPPPTIAKIPPPSHTDINDHSQKEKAGGNTPDTHSIEEKLRESPKVKVVERKDPIAEPTIVKHKQPIDQSLSDNQKVKQTSIQPTNLSKPFDKVGKIKGSRKKDDVKRQSYTYKGKIWLQP